MVLRHTPLREIGQILAALATGTAESDADEAAPPVRGWQIDLLADALERLLVMDAPIDVCETRLPIREALARLSCAQHSRATEIRRLADAADSLPATARREREELVARARAAFAEAARDQRRKDLVRKVLVTLSPIPEPGDPMQDQDTHSDMPWTASAARHLVVTGHDRIHRRLLVENLRDGGWTVREAADSAALLDRVARAFLTGRYREPLDLVVADARNEGNRALEAVAQLRQVDWATPVVVVAPAEGEDIVEEAKRLGATAILRAPIRTAELLELLSSLLA